MTQENLAAPWLLFESGALAKSLEGSKVVPLLFGVELRDISGPLAQFQAKKLDRNGPSEVASSINKSLPTPGCGRPPRPLLDAMWPTIQHKIEAVPKHEGDAKRARSQADILEELVTSVRSFDSRLGEAEMALSWSGIRHGGRRPRFYLPAVLEVLSEIEGDDPLGLLAVAGVLREDLPWMSEILVEGYREARGGDPHSIGRMAERIQRFTRIMMRSPLMEGLGSPKEHHMLIMEMPRILGRYLQRIDVERSGEQATRKERMAPSVAKS